MVDRTLVLSFAESWAANVPEVHELWLFGSQAKGTANIESDWDFGLVSTLDSETERTELWFDRHIEWTNELSRLTGVNVHLELAEPDGHQSRVWPAILEHGIKVYPVE